jgi:hypothetical protein
MAAQDFNVSIARREMSPALPIGVATIVNAPELETPLSCAPDGLLPFLPWVGFLRAGEAGALEEWGNAALGADMDRLDVQAGRRSRHCCGIDCGGIARRLWRQSIGPRYNHTSAR